MPFQAGHRCPRCKKHRSPLLFQKQGQIYQTCSSCRSSSQQQAARERMRETYRKRAERRRNHSTLPPIPETTIAEHPREFRPSLCNKDVARYREVHEAFVNHQWIVDAHPGIAYCQRHQCQTVRDRVEATCLRCFDEAARWQAETRPMPDPWVEREREETFAPPVGRAGWKPKRSTAPRTTPRSDLAWVERS